MKNTITLNNGVKIPIIENGPAAVGYSPKQKKRLKGILK